MAPPELTGDAPGFDIVEPVEIRLLPRLRHERRVAVLHCLQRRLRQRLGIDEPLVGKHRLDDDLRAVAEGLHDGFGFDERHPLFEVPDLIRDVDRLCSGFAIFLSSARPRLGGRGSGCGHHHRQPLGGDLLDHPRARLEAVEAAQLIGDEVHRGDGVLVEILLAARDALGDLRFLGIGSAVAAHRGLRVHQVVHRDIPALGDLIVVEVMRAGDLHRARAEIRVGILVGDDRDQAAVLFRPDRDLAQLADNRFVALVIRMHRDRAIAQHGLRARGGDGDIVPRLAQGDSAVLVLLDILIGLAARQRVFEMPHMARRLDILHFEVRDRRLEMRVPVDQPLALVDQPLVVKLNEHLANGLGQPLIHREALTRPVAGCTQAV